jgi:hypothetical protein
LIRQGNRIPFIAAMNPATIMRSLPVTECVHPRSAWNIQWFLSVVGRTSAVGVDVSAAQTELGLVVTVGRTRVRVASDDLLVQAIKRGNDPGLMEEARFDVLELSESQEAQNRKHHTLADPDHE